jgi:hypothetical protein
MFLLSYHHIEAPDECLAYQLKTSLSTDQASSHICLHFPPLRTPTSTV